MDDTIAVALRVNGRTFQGRCEPRTHLADFLRHELGLTGTHVGCEHGVCGACTVLVDGRAVRGCLMLAAQADGAEVRTVEGLAAADGTLHPLQAAFVEAHALQCGFCTPGILMTLVEVLNDTPDADEAEMREALSGNLCRCTGYQNIVKAALTAAKAVSGVRGA
ncbi:(2Fe-2S)-binding protein [Azospirillum sp. RWY-5-1]|uniref:(2Fe-2S)-binding protein n=1 Tax=Azospirillum oleiclasticum TaxID=2735135 RepID=A0ABX2T9M1_9PROT|nr:(2Fe-2S)-binding protein [Azospirillum oleiclasticum]NYZ13698.1 (2Fe-2S)-binding protein [Azospirillum oleiclasticum]NYZ20970.1 (2Fe-2S)-binding protein [Azospirillum oleiclasticum]